MKVDIDGVIQMAKVPLSQFLRLALKDFTKIRKGRVAGVRLDPSMNKWIGFGSGESDCRVCLAGAAMHRTLGVRFENKEMDREMGLSLFGFGPSDLGALFHCHEVDLTWKTKDIQDSLPAAVAVVVARLQLLNNLRCDMDSAGRKLSQTLWLPGERSAKQVALTQAEFIDTWMRRRPYPRQEITERDWVSPFDPDSTQEWNELCDCMIANIRYLATMLKRAGF